MEWSVEEGTLSKSGRSEWDKKLLRTLVLVNLAAILERADEALLPGVYREVGLSLHASPTSLGSLTLLRSVVQMLCFPLAAYMSMHHNRKSVIALGAMLWAIATFFVGVASTFLQVAISRALNGIGLAMVIPAIQSLVADTASPGKRGLAFGWLQFTGYLGGVFGNVFSVLLAGSTVFGLAGWRASFHIIAAASVVVAFLVYQFAIDPLFKEGSKGGNNYDTATISSSSALRQTFIEAKTVIKIPTFIAIVAQGVAGTFPGAALSFAPMWLELIGFSHNITAAIIGSFSVSISLGGLFGGWLGDIVARRLPNTGRTILAQFSSGIGIPFGAVLLLFLPYDPSTAFLHGAVFFTMGFLFSWCGTATNSPIFAEIVPERMRTSIYALDESFESLLSSFAPPIVGLLAEHAFGYVSSASHTSDDASIVADTKNAAALGKALYVAFGIPYTCCCLLYSLLYWTYPKDRDKAQAESQLNQELAPGITEFHNLKPGYVILSEESEPQPETIKGTNDLKPSEEKEHMLSDVF
eukprot:c25375_g1_i3 orf=158-1732(+)